MEMKLLKPWLQIQLLKTSPTLQGGSAAVPWRSLMLPTAWGICAGDVFKRGCIERCNHFCKSLFVRRGRKQLRSLESKSPPREGRWDGVSRGVAPAEARRKRRDPAIVWMPTGNDGIKIKAS